MRRSSHFERLLLLPLVVVLLQAEADGHEGLEIRIAELTERFAQTADGEILVRRADLHRRHRDWRSAASDLERATELGAPESKVRLVRAMLLLDQHQAARALEVLDGLDTVPALFLRARAFASLGKVNQASAAFARAIAASNPPLPEQFIEHAQLLAGAEPPRIAEAMQVITLGLKTLGPVISLNEEAFGLERQLDPAAALRRVRAVNRGDSPSNPRWLLREVEVLLDLKENDQAATAIAHAKAQLAALPARRRTTPAIREIDSRLDHLAKLLAGPECGGGG